MAAKRFTFITPDQLKQITPLIKSGNVLNIAQVWNTARKKSGHTPWDGKIGVSFYTSGRERRAEVFRISTGDDVIILATLKYNSALSWCSEHLQMTS